VEGRDHQSVPVKQSIQSAIELRPGCPSHRITLVKVEVISSDTGMKQVGLLPTRGLLPRENTRVTN
jgi:hypothetical protein